MISILNNKSKKFLLLKQIPTSPAVNRIVANVNHNKDEIKKKLQINNLFKIKILLKKKKAFYFF
jgi:hypothetical protein